MASVRHRRARPPRVVEERQRRAVWLPKCTEPEPAETVEYYGHLSRRLRVATHELARCKAELVVTHMRFFPELQAAFKIIAEQAARIEVLQREVERSAQIMRPLQVEVVKLPVSRSRRRSGIRRPGVAA